MANSSPNTTERRAMLLPPLPASAEAPVPGLAPSAVTLSAKVEPGRRAAPPFPALPLPICGRQGGYGLRRLARPGYGRTRTVVTSTRPGGGGAKERSHRGHRAHREKSRKGKGTGAGEGR